MVKGFFLAIGDAFAPAERRVLLLSLVGTFVFLVALWFGATFLLAALHVSGISWLDRVIDVLGSFAALFLAWLLFPATSMLMLGFFLDGVIASIEARHYPDLPPARRIGVAESIGSALRLALIALVLNLVILPLYLLPIANVVIFYGINGYLVGREYFEAVALRRLERAGLRSSWHRHRVQLVLAGIVIAFLLSLPVVNLIAPLIGVAFMLHLFESLRRRD